MKSVEEQILNKVNNYNRGKIFFPDNFADLGTSEAIRQALSRLETEGNLVRLGYGIYLYPKIDSQLGVLSPTLDQIAQAIAKRDRAKIVPTGALALNKLGLSTQVPLNAVYLTDGSQRNVQIGNRKIKFKRTVPKNLKAKGGISELVIQALKEIGNGKVRDHQKEKIIELLKKENRDHLRHDIKLAPVWIRNIMEQAVHQ